MNTEYNNVAILGGTFNPIHNAHIMLGLKAYKQFNLDKVLVMPCKNPPHKVNQNILNSIDRSNMVKLAIQDYKELEFSDYEINISEGYSYSANTLTHFANIYKNLYFIIGADSLFYLDKWYHPEIILEKAIIIAANRDNKPIEAFNEKVNFLEKTYNAKILFLQMEDYPISSTQIRDNVKNGISIRDMVDSKVEKYIIDNSLYLD